MVEVSAHPDATEINVDGLIDPKTGIKYIGTALRDPDGRWLCLAQVGEALCRVELRVRPTVIYYRDPGDEHQSRRG